MICYTNTNWVFIFQYLPTILVKITSGPLMVPSYSSCFTLSCVYSMLHVGYNLWPLLFLWTFGSVTQFHFGDQWQMLPAPLQIPLTFTVPSVVASHWKHHSLPGSFLLRLQEQIEPPQRVGRSPRVSILWERCQWQMGVGGLIPQLPCFKKEVNPSLPETPQLSFHFHAGNSRITPNKNLLASSGFSSLGIFDSSVLV